MKTPRAQETGLDVTAADGAKRARRLRTLAAVACEPLEGRKLMTGFAGASAMTPQGGMAGGPAEVGDMGGVRFRRDGGDRFGGGQDVATADAGRPDAPAQGGEMRSFLHADDARGIDGSFGGDRHDLGGGMGGRDFGGRMGDGATGDVPIATQGTPGGQDASSTGDTQLDTDLKKLRTDEQAIHDKSQVTPALQAAVRKDLEAIDAAKTKTADATALATLQADQKSILGAGAKPTDAQQAQLQADQDAVLLSQGVSQALIDQLAADRLAVKTASNFTADDQATLDADHAAIKADLTPTAATATTPATAAATTDASTTAAAATTDAITTAAPTSSTVTPAVPMVPTGGSTATAPADSAATPSPFSSHPMIAAAAPTGGDLDPAMMTKTASTTAAPTRAAGHPGGMGFGRHAGQGFQAAAHDSGGFGGRARRSARR